MLGNRDCTLFLFTEQGKYKKVEDAVQMFNGANPYAIEYNKAECA